MKITRCLHTAILVSDLDKAEQFYSQVLGLVKSPERSLKYAGLWYQIAEYQLHLIVAPGYVSQVVNQEKWGRNPHLALAVDNVQQVKAHLESKGYPIQMSASGRAALFTQDPDGNIIELSQV
ncbi:MAG: VOC family protein [Pleurocapsa sp. MO_192.B19]|nr:VOC family protein [Pleurocapsa sp. MO_192.B19]